MVDAPLTERDALELGSILPEVSRGPVDRTTLALFAGASHDHVRLHIDSDFAKAAGMDDVFGHGMLTMAYLAQALSIWGSPTRLRGWTIRFVSIVPLHAMIHCRGEVTEIFVVDGERRAKLRISAWTDMGLRAIDGEAIMALGEMDDDR